jgi:ribose 5-phosphate isomerase B
MVHAARGRVNLVALASDHAGFVYKEKTKALLTRLGIPFQDFGTNTPDPVDYPDTAHPASQAVANGTCGRGILICGTGIGMSIVANKHEGVRAAACESTVAVELARRHNNANILCLGARLTSWRTAQTMIAAFLTTKAEGGRHARRVKKIRALTGC